jgi:hypothetical protein
LIAVALVVLALACPAARAGLHLGWKSYTDLCEGEDGKSSGAMGLGLGHRLGLGLFELGVGLEYSWGDVDYESLSLDDASFEHLTARADVVVPVLSPAITEIYIGGGVSYNYLWGVSTSFCDTGGPRAGIHLLAGVRISPPILPVWGSAEGRYERLSGDPGIVVSGIYIGVGLGF